MLTTTTRPATDDEQRVQDTILGPRPPASTCSAVAEILLGTTRWQATLGVGIACAAAAITLLRGSMASKALLLLACIIMLLVGRIYWHRRLRPQLSQPPRERLHPAAAVPATVDQWLCIASKYYFWHGTGGLPTLLALTREGDLLLVQTQALDRWMHPDASGAFRLGCMCRYETTLDEPLSLAFEGTPVPVERLHERHPAAGVVNLDRSLIRVPRPTFEALMRPATRR